MKILLVDDSKVARMAVVRLIRSFDNDCEIIEASDVPSAIALVADVLPSAAIVDLNMPGPDGLVLIEHLISKGVAPGSLAVLTANIQGAVRERVKTLGVHFISKPASADALKAFLHKTAG